MANALNRYDMNARVKKVLVRHAVDLSLVQRSPPPETGEEKDENNDS